MGEERIKSYATLKQHLLFIGGCPQLSPLRGDADVGHQIRNLFLDPLLIFFYTSGTVQFITVKFSLEI
jgi:hypothetical protein